MPGLPLHIIRLAVVFVNGQTNPLIRLFRAHLLKVYVLRSIVASCATLAETLMRISSRAFTIFHLVPHRRDANCHPCFTFWILLVWADHGTPVAHAAGHRAWRLGVRVTKQDDIS